MVQFKPSRRVESTCLKSSVTCTLLMAAPATLTHIRLGLTARVAWGWLKWLSREGLTASA